MTGRGNYPPRYLGPTAEDIVQYCQLHTTRELLLEVMARNELRVEVKNHRPIFRWHEMRLDLDMVVARVWVQLRGLYLFRERTGQEGHSPDLQAVTAELEEMVKEAKQTGQWPTKGEENGQTFD